MHLLRRPLADALDSAGIVVKFKALVLALAVGLLAAPLAAQAQGEAKVHRIGYLNLRSGPVAQDEAFLKGLRELGYVEGRNLVIEYRWAAEKEDRLPALAADLVQLNVEVIVTSATPAISAAKRATSTIAILMAAVADPVGKAPMTSNPPSTLRLGAVWGVSCGTPAPVVQEPLDCWSQASLGQYSPLAHERAGTHYTGASTISRAARRPDWSAPCIQPIQGEVCSPAKWTRPSGVARDGPSARSCPGRNHT